MQLSGTNVRKFFGDSSDGAYNSTGDTTWTVTTPDEDSVVKQFTTFTLNAGHTLTVSDRCRGVFIFCTGDVTINGTINMDYKAPLAPVDSTLPPIMPVVLRDGLYHPGQGIDPSSRNVIIFPIGGAGGRGGGGGSAGSYGMVGGRGGKGSMPSWWGGGRGGGGGGGAARGGNAATGIGGNGADADYTTASGAGAEGAEIQTSASNDDVANGAAGTIAGGGGSGGVSFDSSGPGTTIVSVFSGAGGNGGGGGGGGGYGLSSIPATSPDYGNPGLSVSNHYGGGALYIVTRGNLVIGSTGAIYARGSNGGNGGDGKTLSLNNNMPSMAGGGGGGGGAGGGVICLLYVGTYTNNGANNLLVTGGTGGTPGVPSFFIDDLDNNDNVDGANLAGAGEYGCDGYAGMVITRQIQ